MTDKAPRVIDYLRHIVDAIERVREYTQGVSEQEFYSNTLLQDAAIRNFEIMGEASRNVERHGKNLPELQDKLKVFREVYWMRNALAHGYFDVNLTIVWNAIKGDLDVLEQQVQELYQKLHK